MKKFSIFLLLILLCTGCEVEYKTKAKTVNLEEQLYVKGISKEIISIGRTSSSRWLYHVGTLTGRDTIFIIRGKIVQGSAEEDAELKLGEKIIIRDAESKNNN